MTIRRAPGITPGARFQLSETNLTNSMTTYAQDTSVPVKKSRAEIEGTLAKYGASRFGYMTNESEAVIVFMLAGKAIRFSLPLPNQRGEEITKRTYYRAGVKREGGVNSPELARKLWEQACRSRWRSLALCVKAKLEACAAGITTFEEEFLAHIVTPDGSTVGKKLLPQIEEMRRIGKQPPLLLSLTE